MKIGYFTHSGISISETFIYDLIKGLEKKSDLIWFSGQLDITNKVVEQQIATNYSSFNASLPFLAFKIGQLIGIGYILKMYTRLFLSNQALKKFKKNDFPDVAYVDYLTSAVLLRRFFEESGLPYVVHVHGYDISSELKDPEYKKEIKKVFASVSFVIAASEYIKRLLVLAECPPEKIVVIRYGVSADSIIPLSWEQRLKCIPSIIFLGRLTEKKNPIALIHAFNIVRATIQDVKLTIIGDGPLRKEVEGLINSLGLQGYVSMLGALPREESFPIMNQHWIYAQHSVTAVSGDKEGYAISLAEAALHELPVVSTIHNGITEQVIEGKTGFLVPEFDYESMAERIIRLIEDPSLAQQMGEFGRKNIKVLNEPFRRIESVYNLLEKAFLKKNLSESVKKVQL